MARIFKGMFAAFLFIAMTAPCSYCETITIDELVNQFSHATDVQKAQLEKHYRYEKLNVDGIIKNVEPWDTFDEKTDVGRHYFKVVTEPKKTADGIPYEILVFYKNRDKVKALDKGQEIRLESAYLKIIDQRLIYSVWVYAEDLTPEVKEAFM